VGHLSLRCGAHFVEEGFHRGDVGEAVPALAVDAQLARGLRPPQHQQPEQHGGLLRHHHRALEVVFPAHDAAAAGGEREGAALQPVQRFLHSASARLVTARGRFSGCSPPPAH
jgi:hypothetical protein